MFPNAPSAAVPLLLLLAANAAGQDVYPYFAIDLGPVNPAYAGVLGKELDPTGQFACGTAVWDPFVWSRSGGVVVLQKPTNYRNGEAFDVDSSGRAVGSCGLLTTGPTPLVGVLWDALGVPTTLGHLGGTWSRALAINNAGLVVGDADRGGRTHVFTWTAAGGMVDFTPTAQVARFYDLNERGQMLLFVDGVYLRHTPGEQPLPLGPRVGFSLNELGQIAAMDQASSVFLRYTDGIGWEPIGNGAPVLMRELGGMNSFGQLTGTQFILQHNSPPSYEKRGHLYTDGLGFVRLDDWIDPAQLARVYYAEDIDDEGNILVSGNIGQKNRAILLEPRFVHGYANACAGGGGREPKLTACGVPAAGRDLAVLTAGGVPSGTALLLLSPASANLPLPGGCTALVDVALAATLPLRLNPVGQASLMFRIPPEVSGATLYAQLATIDAGAGNGFFALSRGLRIDLQ